MMNSISRSAELIPKAMQRSIITCFFSLLLAGCVSSYWDVSGQGARSASGGCAPTPEVQLTTHLTPDTAVVFWGSVDSLRPDHKIISVSFTFFNDDVVMLTEPELLVSSKSNSIPRGVPITAVRRALSLVSPSCDPPTDAAYQDPQQPMHRMPGILNGEAVTDSVFVIDIVLSDDPAQIAVQLPPISINGQFAHVPPVTFSRRLRVSLPALL